MINIITGLIAPTHGQVFINGLDSESDVTEVQQIIGVCPQDDILCMNILIISILHTNDAIIVFN